MVQQAQNVVDHFEAVSLRVAGLTARAVTAQIHRDDVIRSAELVEEPAVDPSRTDAEDEAVQQDHGLAFARNYVANVDAVGGESARFGTHGFDRAAATRNAAPRADRHGSRDRPGS